MKMKRNKKLKPLLLLVLLCAVLAWCHWGPGEALPANGCPPSVMVDGTLYYAFSARTPAPEEGALSGTIRSQSVPITTVPQEDDTSNFEACVGQPYAFVDGELLLYYSGQWNRCVPAEVHQLDPT